MKLDIMSMILGGFLWEICAAYVHFVVKPSIEKWRRQFKGDIALRKMKETDYKETAIGFNCILRKDTL